MRGLGADADRYRGRATDVCIAGFPDREASRRGTRFDLLLAHAGTETSASNSTLVFAGCSLSHAGLRGLISCDFVQNSAD